MLAKTNLKKLGMSVSEFRENNHRPTNLRNIREIHGKQYEKITVGV